MPDSTLKIEGARYVITMDGSGASYATGRW